MSEKAKDQRSPNCVGERRHDKTMIYDNKTGELKREGRRELFVCSSFVLSEYLTGNYWESLK